MKLSTTLSVMLAALVVFTSVGLVGCTSDKPSAPANDCGSPQPKNCPKLRALDLDGKWRLAAFRASGSWSKGAERSAAKLLGQHVRIQGRSVSLPDRTTCRIVSFGPTRVRDDFRTFGSPNGSWKKLGLTPEPDGSYQVKQAVFNCSGMFQGIVMQRENGVYLLRVWEVYLLMKKEE